MDEKLSPDEICELLQCALSDTPRVRSRHRLAALKLVVKGLFQARPGDVIYLGTLPVIKDDAQLQLTEAGREVLRSLNPADFEQDGEQPSAEVIREAAVDPWPPMQQLTRSSRRTCAASVRRTSGGMGC